MPNDIEKLLLVDDDDNIRMIAQTSLEGLTSWKISAASGGAEAVEKVKEDRPDVVLLDMMMPGMDGPATFERIKAHGSSIPVIFMTAKVQKHEVDNYLKLGAIGVIVKPFDPMKLPEQIVELWQKNK